MSHWDGPHPSLSTCSLPLCAALPFHRPLLPRSSPPPHWRVFLLSNPSDRVDRRLALPHHSEDKTTTTTTTATPPRQQYESKEDNRGVALREWGGRSEKGGKGEGRRRQGKGKVEERERANVQTPYREERIMRGL